MSAFFASSTASHGQIWDVDIYVRASREDGDKEQSETISNQITMLTDFVHGRPELRLHEIRKDDGISGVTFDRPGFHAVMDDVRSGAANCVVVKDLSRFGRDYIETGKYLEEIFPFMGVRFIAVNDNYDSMAERSAADDVVLPFKNLVNDTYAKDISIKVRSSKAVKRRMAILSVPLLPMATVRTRRIKTSSSLTKEPPKLFDRFSAGSWMV